MPDKIILYKFKTATANEINAHLDACNSLFIPALDAVVDINVYANKIAGGATCFEAWHQNLLVGLVAAYFDSVNNVAFITNVSLLGAYSGRGIAATLLNQCITYARENNFSRVQLEVNKENRKALRLYEKFNFKQYDNKDTLLLMQLELNG